MSEASRTPGPWIQVLLCPECILGAGQRADQAFSIQADPTFKRSDPAAAKALCAANARFIVTAANSHDELVEALENAAAALEAVIRNRPQTEQAPTNIALDVVAEQARAALARATEGGER